MAQKPATPAPRKAETAKKPAVKAPAAKPVKKASGTQAAPPGNLDALVNKYLAALRTAEKTLAEAKALVQTYHDQYPELAAYLPTSAVEERAIHLREDAADESRGEHRFASGFRAEGRGMKCGTPTRSIIGRWRLPLGCKGSRTNSRSASPRSCWLEKPPKARNKHDYSGDCPRPVRWLLGREPARADLLDALQAVDPGAQILLGIGRSVSVAVGP